MFAGELLVLLGMNTLPLTAGVRQAEAQIKGLSATASAQNAAMAKSSGLATAAIVGIGVAVAAGAIEATKSAATFQRSMDLIQTQAGAGRDEVVRMSAALEDMAPSVGTGPQELAAGLYHIESAGLRGAKALEVLKIAAEGAKVGQADLESVSNALVASVLSGIKGVDNMSSAMGTLNGIVGAGNMRMQDLSDSLSSGVLSAARTFGLSLQDVGAALATMTDQGVPAIDAATRLKMTFSLIAAPSGMAAQQLSRIGLSSRQLADDMRQPNGLLVALTDLRDHLRASGLDATESAALLSNAFGGGRTGTTIMTLVNSLDLMDGKLKAIKASTTGFGAAWATEQKEAGAAADRLGANLERLGIEFGTVLLPAAGAAVGVLADLAGHTEILVPLIEALTVVVTILALRALAGLVRSLVAAAAQMAFDTVSAAALAGAFDGLATSELAAGSAAGVAAAGIAGVEVSAAAALAPLLALVVAFEALRDVKIPLGPLQPVGDMLSTARGDQFHGGTISHGLAPAVSAADQAAALQASIDAQVARVRAHQESLSARMEASSSAAPLGGVDVLDETRTLVEQFGTTIDGVRDAAKLAGSKAMLDMAKELADHRDAPLAAMAQLNELMTNQVGRNAEIGRLWGQLTSAGLAVGLASKIPEVAAVATGAQKAIIDRLGEIVPEAKLFGYKAGDAVPPAIAQALRDKGSVAIDAAKVLAENVAAQLDDLRKSAHSIGAATALDLAKGLAEQQAAPLQAMTDLVNLQKTALSKGAQTALLFGMLASKSLAEGLRDGNPAVLAQAIGTRDTIMAQLNAIAPGAYAAGDAAIRAFAAGLISSSAFQAMNRAAAQVAYMRAILSGDTAGAKAALAALQGATSATIPTASAAQASYNAWLKSIQTGAGAARSSLSTLAGDARDKLKGAFDSIKASARSFFDTLHERNLKAISDAHDLANAQRQSKLDDARTALAAKRNNEQLFQLQKSVGQATTPEERQQAMIELADFQAQLEIDAQQKVVDAQNKVEDQKAAAAKAAEDKRYTQQIADFNRQLAALQAHLARHPAEWRKVQRDVLALLARFGVNYVAAGALLGKKFVDGLRASLKDAEAAAKALAAAGTPKAPGSKPAPVGPTVPGGAPPGTPGHASGAWDISSTELALLHAREMVLPPDLASDVRRLLGGGGMASLVPMLSLARGLGAKRQMPFLGTVAASRLGGLAPGGSSGALAGGGGTQGGGGTIVFQVGSEKLAEFTDRGLYVQHSVYAKPVVHNGSQR